MIRLSTVVPGATERLIDAILTEITARDRGDAAFLSIDAAGARAAARAADRRLQSGERGALLGMPVAVKDAYTTLVPPTTYGTRVVPAALVGAAEASAVGRLRDAGAVIVGKTNCSELCIGEYVLRGSPRSPVTPGRSVGASSGGCAVAVAAGLARASLATDTGGSVRTPAAYCGVVGFKPSFGRIPLDGAVALAPSLDHGGVLAAKVAEAVAVAEAASGVGLAAAAPAERWLLVDPAEVSNVSVAVALGEVARAPRPWGVSLATAPSDPFAGWQEVFEVVMPAEAALVHGALIDDPELGEGARVILAAGRAISPGERDRAHRGRAALVARSAAFLAGETVLIAPAVDGVAPERLPARGSEGFWAEMAWHAPGNLIGGPSISVPVPGTIPTVSLQVLGLPGSDAAVVGTALWLESALAR